MTMRVRIDKVIPVVICGISKVLPKASEMVLAWTELKASPNVRVIKTANVTAHARLPMPLLM